MAFSLDVAESAVELARTDESTPRVMPLLSNRKHTNEEEGPLFCCPKRHSFLFRRGEDCRILSNANAFWKLKEARCGPSAIGSGRICVDRTLAGGPMVARYPWNSFDRIELRGGLRGLQIVASHRVKRLSAERARDVRGKPPALELCARAQRLSDSATRNPGH